MILQNGTKLAEISAEEPEDLSMVRKISIHKSLLFGNFLLKSGLPFCILLIVLFGCVSIGSCADLPESSVEYGETWIKWSFPFVNASIYLDGKLVMDDNDLGYYLLYGVNAREKHVIDVYDLDNGTFYYHESTTYMSLTQIFLIICVIIGCICLGLIMPYMPVIAFLPATGVLMYLIENNFEGWLILFVAFLWLACLIYGGERLGKSFKTVWRTKKRK